MKVKCRNCSETVVAEVVEVDGGKVARCPFCRKLAWTSIKDDVIVTFALSTTGLTAIVAPNF